MNIHKILDVLGEYIIRLEDEIKYKNIEIENYKKKLERERLYENKINWRSNYYGGYSQKLCRTKKVQCEKRKESKKRNVI